MTTLRATGTVQLYFPSSANMTATPLVGRIEMFHVFKMEKT